MDGAGVEHNGRSAIISPKGEAIFTNEGAEIIHTVELNANSLHAFRHRFPAYQDADDFSIEFEYEED
jgi:predicted amidohydrolase